MTRSTPIRTLVIEPAEDGDVVTTALDRTDIETRHTSPSTAASTLDTDPFDCLVTCQWPLDEAIIQTARMHSVPIVAYGVDVPETVDLAGSVVADADPASADDVDRLATQIRLAVDHETRRQLRADRDLITDLHDATARLAAIDSPTELFERTVEVAADVLSFDVCCIDVFDGERLVPVAVSEGVPDGAVRSMEVGEGLSGRTFSTGESIVVDDLSASSSATPVRSEYRSALCVPIGDDGIFQAISTVPAAFDEVDLELAELLVAHVAATFDRITIWEAFRERQARIASLHRGTTDLVGARSADALYQRTVSVAERILAFDVCYIFVAEGDRLVPVARSGSAAGIEIESLPTDRGMAGRTYRTGESVLVGDLSSHPDAAPADGEYGSGISVPIDDRAVFQAVTQDGEPFGDDDLELAELLVAYAAAMLGRIEAESDLRSERDRLRALFENVPDAAVAYEFRNGVAIVERVNSAFERVFGYDEGEIVGTDLDERIVPADEQAEAIRYNHHLQSGQTVRAEVRRRTVDGVSHFLLHVVPVRLDEANGAGYAIYTDLSEQKARERELERQNERLDEFASVVSHDLRNPLSVATGYLELVREDYDDPNVEKAANALDRMSLLVEDLLNLARKGSFIGNYSACDLGSIARDAWDDVDTADATLEISGEHTLDADCNRLAELLGNLFRNAIEHGSPDDRTSSDDAGHSLTVRVGSTPDGFYVEDDGTGIDPERYEQVFETGFTTTQEGTGFGLVIVRRIAEAHGWTVRATESDTGGARFEFVTADA